VSEETAPAAAGRMPATDEVLRRVGRNLVIFQQVELVLKFLTTHARFHAPASQFAERFGKHTESIRKKSMGDLAGKLVDTVDEPTPGSGTRTIYRINERWRLESPGADSTA
jgi:hypothetical protein